MTAVTVPPPRTHQLIECALREATGPARRVSCATFSPRRTFATPRRVTERPPARHSAPDCATPAPSRVTCSDGSLRMSLSQYGGLTHCLLENIRVWSA